MINIKDSAFIVEKKENFSDAKPVTQGFFRNPHNINLQPAKTHILCIGVDLQDVGAER